MEKTKLMKEVEKKQGRSIIEILREEFFNTKQGRSYREIAKSLGVDRTTISDWSRRLKIYKSCLSICICPFCKKRYDCEGFKESHQKGYCVFSCVDYKQETTQQETKTAP